MITKIKNICCIGAGYVGGPTMAIIAERCPNIQVEVVDLNEERIKNCNNKDLKVHAWLNIYYLWSSPKKPPQVDHLFFTQSILSKLVFRKR